MDDLGIALCATCYAGNPADTTGRCLSLSHSMEPEVFFMKDPRYNIYTLIHKGLRASLCQQLVELGRVDDTDTEAVTQQLDACDHLLRFCISHLQHENHFIHALLDEKRRIPAQLDVSPLQTALDHQQHEQEIKKLQAEIALIKQLPALRRRHVLLDFYSEFSLFVAENFTHMQVEETYNAELLWKFCSDAEIRNIQQRLIASLSPEENLQSLLMMLPNITHTERIEVLKPMAQVVPVETLTQLLLMLKPLLNHREWHKLNQEVELSSLVADEV